MDEVGFEHNPASGIVLARKGRVLKMNKLTNPEFVVNKKSFPHIMDKCVTILDSTIIKTAFETCGRYPWKRQRSKERQIPE